MFFVLIREIRVSLRMSKPRQTKCVYQRSGAATARRRGPALSRSHPFTYAFGLWDVRVKALPHVRVVRHISRFRSLAHPALWDGSEALFTTPRMDYGKNGP